MVGTGLRGITMEREQNSRGGCVGFMLIKIGSLCEGLDMKIIEMSGI
jgi:hypothetical protein